MMAEKTALRVRAWQLGAGTEMEKEMVAQGKIKRRKDGTYEVFSMEATGETGQIAKAGDYFKLDDSGKPYPNDKAFFEKLMHLMSLTLQMRNSVTGTDVDYMISPVADENGNFYDSRTCGKNLPENADANGAYNIARKGLWVARQIQATPVDEKANWAITNKEWLNFAQTKPYLND